MDADTRVAELSEGELLAAITSLLPRGRHTLVPTGDDAAVVAAPDGRFVVSTDLLVEGHHFRDGWGSAQDVGWRAAMQNLADVAAMGATPLSMVVGLVLPRERRVAWVLGLARGLAEACAPLGVGVDGGDLSAGEAVVVAVTVHGDLEGRDPILRSGARDGDVLAHAGVLGHGAAGYALLAAGEAQASATDAELVRDFLRPRPPLASGPLAAQAGATAMMDVSDGLLRDAGRLARASGVVLDLDPLPVSAADELDRLTTVARHLGADSRDWVLTGGEDHGLLATFPSSVPLPAGFRRLGRVAPGAPRVLLEGRVPDVASEGWDHFRSI